MAVVLTNAARGQAYDPINTPGNWHNSSLLRRVHTHSPAISPRYDGQGLSYIPGTYRTLGNNGTHVCCNSSITTGSGASSLVLNVFMNTSDHLPVSADYQLPADYTVWRDTVGQNVALAGAGADGNGDLEAVPSSEIDRERTGPSWSSVRVMRRSAVSRQRSACHDTAES